MRNDIIYCNFERVENYIKSVNSKIMYEYVFSILILLRGIANKRGEIYVIILSVALKTRLNV